jgi:hypothetical protein
LSNLEDNDPAHRGPGGASPAPMATPRAVLNELMVANVVMRRGHGLYGLTDPFVQEIWRERNALMLPPGESG